MDQQNKKAQLRRGEVSDSVSIAAIYEEARAGMVYVPRLYSRDQVLAFLVREIADHQCVVVANDEEAVGFVIYDRHLLRHLYVRSDYQRQGLGSALFEWVKSQSRGDLELWTFQKNLTARRFFERHGLRCVEETDGSNNPERVPDAHYVWAGK